jgi:hypothetical protein
MLFVKLRELINSIDFLQIDVQGANLDVLQGGSQIINSILGVQVEVEFSQMYINQPLFNDVDVFLRNKGFTLFDLLTFCLPRAKSPIAAKNRRGQILWGDAFYLQDPLGENVNPAFKEPSQILKIACIADVLELYDYALELLEYLTINYGDDLKYNFAETIIKSLSKFPELVEKGLDSLSIVDSIRPYLQK